MFPQDLVQQLNRYCQQVGRTEMARQAFRTAAGAIASGLHDQRVERLSMMRCREWLLLALAEEFRTYAPMPAVRSVSGGDSEGLLAFLPEGDSLSRSVFRLMGLNLLVNKLASGEVLVTTAGSVACGKSTLICQLSGVDTSHLRSDEKGQSVVTLLVSPGAETKLAAMPLSGGMQGRDEDRDETWGSTSGEATAHLADILRVRTGDVVPLSRAMEYFASNVYDAARLASLKATRPTSDGFWSELQIEGAKATLLDARGFNTIADPQTVEAGHLFAQGAEVPVVLASLQGSWDLATDSDRRFKQLGGEYTAYLDGIAAVLGNEMPGRTIIVFTFLNHLADPSKETEETVEAPEMTRRVCKVMADNVAKITDAFRRDKLDPSGVRWLLFDNIGLRTPERRRMFWELLPPAVLDTYGNKDQFEDWFVRDGGIRGLCSVARSTIEEVVLPKRTEEAREILRLLGGERLHAMFNDTFPHLVPECSHMFREKPFLDYSRQEFNDQLDTQQVEGAARELLERVNREGVARAHEVFWACSFDGASAGTDLNDAERMLVERFYPGTYTGFSAFLRTRSDSGSVPPGTRVLELAMAAFIDILHSIIDRDGEGTKEFLKDFLREKTGKVRQAFADYSPLARDLCDAVNTFDA